MQKDGIWLGPAEQSRIDLVREEDMLALLAFVFFPHAGPDIGVDHISAGGGFVRIIGYGASATRLGATLAGPRHRRRIEFVSRRRSQPNMRAQLGSGKQQGACDVIAIAYKHDLQTLQLAFSLPNGE